MPKLTDERVIAVQIHFFASYSYVQPLLVLYPNWIRILIPSFVSGYIIVNISEMIAIAMGHRHVFIETILAGIGCVMNLLCGIFEMYQWTSWFSSVIEDVKIIGWQELLLAISCLLNALVLLIDFIRYAHQWAPENLRLVEDSVD